MTASVEVIAEQVKLMKEDLSRRLDDHREDIRGMRSEMSSSYVHHQAYQAEYGRVTDRIANAEADIVEMRTSLATQFIDIHGHIDRKFDEIKMSRRWVAGVMVTVILGFLSSATAIAIAVIGSSG